MEQRPKLRAVRHWARYCIAALVIAVVLELTASYIGFGDPPLALPDGEIEYYLAPNQSHARFGQAIRTNRYGMRSDDADLRALDRRLSISLFGDSVVYGHRLDQADTLSAQVQTLLRQNEKNRGLTVNNIAASSWGPENLLAFYRRFGPYPGRTVWIVQSTHDMTDVIDHSDLPYTTAGPYCALHDAGLSAWRWAMSRMRLPGGNDQAPPENRRRRADIALKALIESLKRDFQRVILVFHATRDEAISGQTAGLVHYDAVAKAHDIGFISTMELYARAYAANTAPHYDDIHLSKAGVEMLARQLVANLRSAGLDE